MIASLALAAFFVAGLVIAIRRLPALHPIQLWFGPWAAMTVLFCMRLLPYRWLDWTTVVVVITATLAFSGGALWAERMYAGRARPEVRVRTPLAVELGALGALALCLAGMLVFIYQAGSQIGYANVLKSTLAARIAILDGTAAASISYLYFSLAAAVLCALAAARARAGGRRGLWMGAAALAIGSTYFATGRTFTFIALGAAGAAYAIARGDTLRPRRVAAVAGALAAGFLLAFVAVGNLQNRTLETSTSLYGVPSVFKDHRAISQLAIPYQYATSPLPALNVQLDATGAFGRSDGCATFRVGCALLANAGVDAEPESPVMPYTSNPLRWNTYTALDLPVRDGGAVLAIPIMLVLGGLVGLAWAAARQGTLLGLVAYPVFASATLLATWQNNFASQILLGAIIIAAVLALGGSRLSSTLERRSRARVA